MLMHVGCDMSTIPPSPQDMALMCRIRRIMGEGCELHRESNPAPPVHIAQAFEMYICIYVHMYICINVYMYICISVYMCICVCVYVCTCVYVYMCMCICVYM